MALTNRLIHGGFAGFEYEEDGKRYRTLELTGNGFYAVIPLPLDPKNPQKQIYKGDTFLTRKFAEQLFEALDAAAEDSDAPSLPPASDKKMRTGLGQLMADLQAENERLTRERDEARAALAQIQEMTRSFVEANKSITQVSPSGAFWRIAAVEKIAREAAQQPDASE